MLPAKQAKHFLFNRSFSLFHVNIRSLQDKFDELKACLATMDIEFSCIVISETWLLQDDFIAQYKLPGYDLLCSSRAKSSRGGGVCIYVSQKFETRVDTVGLDGAESLVCYRSRF